MVSVNITGTIYYNDVEGNTKLPIDKALGWTTDYRIIYPFDSNPL
jgi:hypothetical protein